MNNKTIGIAIAVVLVLAAIIGGTAIYNEKKQKDEQAKVTSTTPTETGVDSNTTADESTPAESKSFKDILNGGSSVECTFTNTDDKNAQMSGTMVTDGTMMAGDYQVQTAGTTMRGYMIMRDGYMYSWLDTMPGGMKFKLFAGNQPADSNQNNLDTDKKMDVTCKPWNTDASRFILPTDRTFTDISAVITEPSTGGGSGGGSVKIDGATGANTNQCVMCDNLVGDKKTQCRNALGCK